MEGSNFSFGGAEKQEAQNCENAGSVRFSANTTLAGKNRQQQQNSRETSNDEHDDDNESKISNQINIVLFVRTLSWLAHGCSVVTDGVCLDVIMVGTWMLCDVVMAGT